MVYLNNIGSATIHSYDPNNYGFHCFDYISIGWKGEAERGREREGEKGMGIGGRGERGRGGERVCVCVFS